MQTANIEKQSKLVVNEKLSQDIEPMQNNIESLYQSCEQSGKENSDKTQSDVDYQEESSQEYGKTNHLRKYFGSQNEEQECLDILQRITQNFKNSYLKIKDSQELQQAPLKFQSKKNIQYLIRYWRQKLKREGKLIQIENNNIQQLLKKRKRKESNNDYIYHDHSKRPKKDSDPNNNEQERSLALTIIQDFQTFDDNLKNKILNGVNEMIKNDHDLLLTAIQKQVIENKARACQFYENQMIKDLLAIMNSISPLAVIYLHIEISLTNNDLTEEGNTLSSTLLPFINIWYDYQFIKTKEQFILTRFFHSIINHIRDTNMEVQKGFMLYALTIDPQKIPEILVNEKNRVALSKSLLHLGFSQKATNIFLLKPNHLIYADVLSYLQGKEDNMVIENFSILSKLKIQKDPGIHLKSLNNIFAQRRILVDYLISVKKIDLPIEILMVILDNLKVLHIETIKQCFEINCESWLKYSIQQLNQEETIQNIIPEEKLIQMYDNMITSKEGCVHINEMNEISQQISQDINMYNHNTFQCTIASIIASCPDQFILAIIPTGAGKTWIQGLLAKYYCKLKHRVNIIEPKEALQFQTAEKIGPVDFRKSISTIQWFYQYLPQDDIIILDEYDEIVTKNSFIIFNNMIKGLWNFKNRKVIAFSATSNSALEKYIRNTISEPKILKFQSQYEIIHGMKNLQLGNVATSINKEQMMNNIKEDLTKYYEKKPIILVIDKIQEAEIIEILKTQKFKFVNGCHEKALQEIRSWDYGILVLKLEDARGIDTKFSKDAIVLIVANVTNELQYQQCLGRASRSLGYCEGILYSSSGENTNQIINRLKKQNFTFYQQLEYLLKLLQKNSTNQNLSQALLKAQKSEKQIYSIEELSKLVGNKHYQQLIKDLSF